MALGHGFVVVIGRLQSVKNTLVEVAKDFGVTDVLTLRLAFNPHACGASRLPGIDFYSIHLGCHP